MRCQIRECFYLELTYAEIKSNASAMMPDVHRGKIAIQTLISATLEVVRQRDDRIILPEEHLNLSIHTQRLKLRCF